MKNLFIVIGLFICFSISAFSQAGFRPGFIITNEGDTIQGKVAYLDETILLRTCQFIEEGASMATTYTPGEIYGYGFSGDKFFVSKEVSVFTPAQVRRSISGDRQIPESTIQEKVFLELIVQGAASLYKYNPLIFYAGKNGDFFQLYSEEREFVVQSDSRSATYAQDFKRYVGVLQIIMGDCPDLGAKINRLSLTEELLSKLFIDYSKCRGVTPIHFKEGRRRVTISYSLLGGIMGSQNSFADPVKKSKAFADANLGFQTRPGFGAMISLSNQRTGENVSLQFGLFFVQYNYQGFSTSIQGVVTNEHTIEMALTEVKIPVGIKYTFIRRAVTPYVSGGGIFVMNTGVKDEWLWVEVTSLGSNVRRTPEDFVKGIQGGGWVSGGLEIPVMNRIALVAELGLQYTNGLINSRSSDLHITRSGKTTAQFLVGLKF
jgi:hypothetical protein